MSHGDAITWAAQVVNNSPMSHFSLILFLLIGPIVFCGGCALTLKPTEHRAQQYSTHFDSYDAPTKERLREAVIAVGDDRAAVYIALGKPQQRRMGYDRHPVSNAVILLEYWDYSGQPDDSQRKGQFTTLNNGSFASPFSSRPYGVVSVEFADGLVRNYVYDPDRNVTDFNSRLMFIPPDPHR